MSEINKAKLKSKINTWKPKASQKIVENDGKIFIVHFDRVFPEYSNLKQLNRFFVKKTSYENQLDIISKYINFFINCYDTDNELIMAYLKIKYEIDKMDEETGKRRFTKDNMGALIDFIYEIMFTPTICEKVRKMVEENYLDDIEADTEKKYKKNNKEYLESLEFTNEHIKILLRISFGMKMMSPILFHYLTINTIKLEKTDNIIYSFYERLFPLFQDNVDMFNKLFVYVSCLSVR